VEVEALARESRVDVGCIIWTMVRNEARFRWCVVCACVSAAGAGWSFLF